jgi:PAB-dependent poly(A)-specific ribonuclease subunit 3
MHQAAFGAIETWSRVGHPSIVRVREAFTTRAFNDNSLVVTYEYYPNVHQAEATAISAWPSFNPLSSIA